MNFSVLMSIYYKERAEYFERAIQSIWDEQTVKPNEIVLVQDGKLTDELYLSIKELKNKLGEVLKIVPLEQNVGLGDALNEGIKYCSYELVARMDADDIAMPDRFYKQLKVFENSSIDICSSWVGEFNSDEKEIVSYRKIPEKHDEIVSYSKMRNGINHPAVIYKKIVIEKAGGYQHMLWFEDYFLWIRMFLVGAKSYNIQEPLVYMRVGNGQLERRSGFAYICAEWNFLFRVRKIGFINNFEFIRNVAMRLTARAMPKFVIQRIYQILRK